MSNLPRIATTTNAMYEAGLTLHRDNNGELVEDKPGLNYYSYTAHKAGRLIIGLENDGELLPVFKEEVEGEIAIYPTTTYRDDHFLMYKDDNLMEWQVAIDADNPTEGLKFFGKHPIREGFIYINGKPYDRVNLERKPMPWNPQTGTFEEISTLEVAEFIDPHKLSDERLDIERMRYGDILNAIKGSGPLSQLRVPSEI